MISYYDENFWWCLLLFVEIVIMRRCCFYIRNSYIVVKFLVVLLLCFLVSFGDYKDFKNYYWSCCDSMLFEEDFEMYEVVGDLFLLYIIKMVFFYVIEEKVVWEGV